MKDPKDAIDAAGDTVRDVADAADRRVRDLGGFIREQREAAQLSVRHLAKRAGVSNPYLSQIERGLRKPSAEILQSIASALRISAETLYVKAGILEERQTDLASAILSDQTLTEKQRRALLEIYRSFTAGHDEVDTTRQADDDAPGEAEEHAS
ncbi:helix-turn-helix domain-containing protein [Euzebya rosea]|uniref:helix-turn-helix domain-containing protein n=1 Tax=Euzebya rosea TaxID=2052804 RepID=UPI0023E7EC56|nr:helix-turn-helix transcriptional regulator [Euzebya rosea]